jgi:hypothetical protein
LTNQSFYQQYQSEVYDMHKRLQLSLLAILFIAGVALLSAQEATAKSDDSDAFVGSWEGTWTGGSAGTFGVTISKGAGGKLSGSISPKPDQGDGYTAAFKTVEVISGKLTAKFDDPNGEAEITLVGSVTGKSAKGTYSVKQKGDGSEVDTGSWTLTKK